MSYFDRFDICLAYFHLAVDYNGDAYTNAIHGRLSRIGFRPSRSEEYLKNCNENARAIYGALVRRRYGRLMAADRLRRRANGRIGVVFPGGGKINASREVLACYGGAS